jgi:hypothetical protein
MHGYTAQMITTEGQIVVAADVICGGNERRGLQSLIDDVERELKDAAE